jgi:hypothetical protein
MPQLANQPNDPRPKAGGLSASGPEISVKRLNQPQTQGLESH